MSEFEQARNEIHQIVKQKEEREIQQAKELEEVQLARLRSQQKEKVRHKNIGKNTIYLLNEGIGILTTINSEVLDGAATIHPWFEVTIPEHSHYEPITGDASAGYAWVSSFTTVHKALSCLETSIQVPQVGKLLVAIPLSAQPAENALIFLNDIACIEKPEVKISLGLPSDNFQQELQHKLLDTLVGFYKKTFHYQPDSTPSGWSNIGESKEVI